MKLASQSLTQNRPDSPRKYVRTERILSPPNWCDDKASRHKKRTGQTDTDGSRIDALISLLFPKT